ncbi:MAG: hypothetical protein H6748_15825 [Spirochaetaceae bacterium]|nr:hypothetical protein [Myxococcales bacterium]MCB9725517.1 hypothetical protein [Spirochaetaceae bacterium]
MAESQVRGSMLRSVFLALSGMRKARALSEERIASSLSPAAIRLIEHAPLPIGWYPVSIYREALDLFWEVGARGDAALLARGGAEVARKIFHDTAYREFFGSERGHRARDRDDLMRRLRFVTRLNRLFYDDIELAASYDPERDEVSLTYENAAEFSEAMFVGTHGHLDELASLAFGLHDEAGKPQIRWHASRPTADRIVFSHPAAPFVTTA